MIETKFKAGQEYKTRGGYRVIVSAIEGLSPSDSHPIKGILFDPVVGDWIFGDWNEKGSCGGKAADCDLIFPAEIKRVPLEFGDILPGAHARNKHTAKSIHQVNAVYQDTLDIGETCHSYDNLFLRTDTEHELEWRPDKDSPWRPFYKEVEV